MSSGSQFALAFSGIEPVPDEHAISFYQRHKSVFDPIFRKASGFLNSDLNVYFKNHDAQLTDPLTNQILTYAYGVAISDVLKKHGIVPSLVAGFSLGVYAALAAARIVSFETGLNMVNKAYEFMRSLSGDKRYGMSAVVGLSESDIHKILTEQRLTSLHLANTLSETCSIYSGERRELGLLHESAYAAGCLNAVALPVNIPYHHPQLLKDATAEFAGFLDTVEWKTSFVPVISSISQELLTDTADIKEFIAQNLSQPIHWQKVIEKVASHNNDFIVECGPGLTITRNGRFIDADIKYINVKNIKKKLDI